MIMWKQSQPSTPIGANAFQTQARETLRDAEKKNVLADNELNKTE